jgi:hypothetical protein
MLIDPIVNSSNNIKEHTLVLFLILILILLNCFCKIVQYSIILAL